MVALLTMVFLEEQPLRSSFGKVFMGAAGSGGPSDDQFNRVSFLSHFDGANNGVNNAFDDGSTSNHTITANGNVTQGSFGPFARPDGEWAVSFDGTGDYFEVSNPTSTAFGTGDFTLECWVYMAVDNTNKAIVETRASDLSANGFVFAIDSGGGRKLMVYSNAKLFTTSNAISLNTWTHIAISRSGTTLKCFINGTQGASVTNSQDYTNALVRVGRGIYASSDFNGLISNLRLVNSAVYTSNFTPPTAALTAITNTKLLACQSNRFVDNSASALTITPSGNAAVSAFGPFLTDAVYDPAVNGASAYFDGSGDALRVSDTASLRIGTGQYTIECWFWFDVLTSDNSGIFAKRDSSSDYWRILATSSGVNFRINSDIVSDSTVVNKKCWNHIAITRDSNNDNRIYVNGSLINTISSSVNISNTGTVRLGEFQADAGPMTGYICDARIVIGTAVYTGSSLTLPTAPLTAITNTKLLLNMADGQAIDSAAQNNLMLYGTAKTSTVQKKFGTASLLLDGNSDYAEIPSAAGDFGSGDWTIECSIRLVGNVSSRDVFIAKWEKSGNKRGYRLAVINSSGNKIELKTSSNGSGGTAIGTTVFATNLNSYTWYNIALVNSSGTVKLYVNGTADSTTHSLASGAPYQNPGIVFLLGASVPSDPELFFNGYIDEVRLSKFARYTSNYTSPTEPFADKGQ